MSKGDADFLIWPAQNEDGFICIDGSGEAGDMIQRSGPRYVEGLKLLAELIYPEIAE